MIHDLAVNLMNDIIAVFDLLALFGLASGVIFLIINSYLVIRSIRIHSVYSARFSSAAIITAPFIIVPLLFTIFSLYAYWYRKKHLLKARMKRAALKEEKDREKNLPAQTDLPSPDGQKRTPEKKKLSRSSRRAKNKKALRKKKAEKMKKTAEEKKKKESKSRTASAASTASTVKQEAGKQADKDSTQSVQPLS